MTIENTIVLMLSSVLDLSHMIRNSMNQLQFVSLSIQNIAPMESKLYIYKDETPVEDLGCGVSRQILGYNENLMMVKVLFAKDAIGTLHTHIHTQTTYCASGVFKFQIGGEIQLLHEGDAAFIPSGMLHGVVCLHEGVLIDVFNPVREDFL